MPTDHPEFVHPSNPGGAEQLIGETLAAIRAADGNVVVGPWLGEVGFEVLYWIPFLHWLFEEHGIPTADVTVVSRGGVAPWYEGLAGRYVDVFDHITAEDFRRQTLELWAQTGGLQKQVAVRSWDEQVLDATLGETWRDGALLHPQLLYRLFRNVWQAALPVRDFLDRAVHRPWVEPEPTTRLPEEFTAVRFYFRDSFPDTPENRERRPRRRRAARRAAAGRPAEHGRRRRRAPGRRAGSTTASSGRWPASSPHGTSRSRAPWSPGRSSSQAPTAGSLTWRPSTACRRSASPANRPRSIRFTSRSLAGPPSSTRPRSPSSRPGLRASGGGVSVAHRAEVAR